MMLAAVVGVPAAAAAQGVDADLAPERGLWVGDLPPRDPEDEEERERERPYREGALVPPGYRVTTGYHAPLLGTGAAVLSFHWVLSVALAQVDFSLEGEPARRVVARNDALMAPVIGPFIALGTDSERPSGEYALLVVDGVMQVGGLLMVALGLAIKTKWLTPVGDARAPLAVRF